MSTVRMSDYLKRDIVRQFENSHKTAKPLMELDPARGDEIYNTYIGPNIKALQEAAQDAFGDVFDTEQLFVKQAEIKSKVCLLYTSPSPRDVEESRMPSSA